MNRIQMLESDLRRGAARLGKRGTAGARPRAGLPVRAPGPVAPPAPSAPRPGPATGPGPSVGASVGASVGVAMSAWAGAATPGRARGMSARPGRATAMAVTLDYRVPDLPMPIQQTSSMVCWAYVATMMASWRDRRSYTVEGYIGSLGEPWISKLRNNQGLAAAEAPLLLASIGLQIETTQANFTAERWEDMLREWGPIWVTADNNPALRIQGVHAHILVGIHGPSDGDPTVDVFDPATGREEQMRMSDFVARYEQLANTPFAGLQIRHWPAQARQAAQQSLAWAQQEQRRLAREQNAALLGPVIAGAGLLFQVFKELTTTRDLTWRKSELRGQVIPGNREDKRALASQGQYQSKRLRSLRRRVWDEILWDDNVGAEFEISYEYNGSCVANVRLTNVSYAPPRALSGRSLNVDTNIVQSFANEQGDVAAVEVEIVYQFTYARGSAGTFTQRYVLYGDGRQELFSETQS